VTIDACALITDCIQRWFFEFCEFRLNAKGNFKMHDARKVLQAMFKDNAIYIIPGVFEGFGALIAESAGFPALYITGNGLSASSIGMPDYSLMSMDEVVAGHRRITGIVNIPVIGDADTGYGGTLNVYRTVKEFERSGVAAIHLEDQASPKKCAYYKADMNLISAGEFSVKIKAALAARQDPSFAIIARTDAYRPHGLAETIERCRRYAAAGADAIYVVGITSLVDIRAVSQATALPLIVNCNDGDELAMAQVAELKDAGVKMILYPATVRSAVIKGVETALKALAEKGSTKDVLDILAPIKSLNRLNRLSFYQDLERSLEQRP
jgi:2,3-dimethylmalate lyase